MGESALPASSLLLVVSPHFSSLTACPGAFDWPNTAPASRRNLDGSSSLTQRCGQDLAGPQLYKHHWESVPIRVFSSAVLCNGTDAPGAEADQAVLLGRGRNSLGRKMAHLFLGTVLQEKVMQHKHFWMNRLVKCIERDNTAPVGPGLNSFWLVEEERSSYVPL